MFIYKLTLVLPHDDKDRTPVQAPGIPGAKLPISYKILNVRKIILKQISLSLGGETLTLNKNIKNTFRRS